jgi:hypothetical protein
MRKPPKPRRSRSDPEYIQQARERIARLRMNPEFKEKHAAGSRSHMRDLWASPEGRAKMRAAQAAGHARKRAAKLAAEAAKSAPAGSIPANDNGAKALAA